MGRYLTPSGGAGGSGTMRNLRHSITASNPALPVPAWAKMIRISGVGGGAGGNVNSLGGGGVQCGMGGGIAHNAHMVIPAGTSTIALVIGAGGAGKAAGTDGAGADGGNTTVTVGSMVMVLEGGKCNPSGYGLAWVGSPAGGFGGDTRQIATGLMGGFAVSFGGGNSPYGAVGESKPSSAGDGGNGTGYGTGGGGSRDGKGGNGSPGLLIVEFIEAL